MFTVHFVESVADDLADLKASERQLILDRIDEQLSHQPTTPTRNRKMVPGLVPPWEHEQPVWELRVGLFRVFYDVNEAESKVIVRAIRLKPPHKTTEEIL
jgi:mRNA-degrading endonuclease RelE of RelBE toxin-antitoxin system